MLFTYWAEKDRIRAEGLRAFKFRAVEEFWLEASRNLRFVLRSLRSRFWSLKPIAFNPRSPTMP